MSALAATALTTSGLLNQSGLYTFLLMSAPSAHCLRSLLVTSVRGARSALCVSPSSWLCACQHHLLCSEVHLSIHEAPWLAIDTHSSAVVGKEQCGYE